MTNMEYIQSCTKEELVNLLCVELKTDCFRCVAEEYCHSGRVGFTDWLDENREDEDEWDG